MPASAGWPWITGSRHMQKLFHGGMVDVIKAAGESFRLKWLLG